MVCSFYKERAHHTVDILEPLPYNPGSDNNPVFYHNVRFFMIAIRFLTTAWLLFRWLSPLLSRFVKSPVISAYITFCVLTFRSHHIKNTIAIIRSAISFSCLRSNGEYNLSSIVTFSSCELTNSIVRLLNVDEVWVGSTENGRDNSRESILISDYAPIANIKHEFDCSLKKKI